MDGPMNTNPNKPDEAKISLDQLMYRTIRDRIAFMDYAPGFILNEKSLAAEFGVSRTPIREVLNRLEWEKLVRIIPRTGTMVSEMEMRKMMEVYQIRLEIEALVGRLAAEQITDDHLGQIDDIAGECQGLYAQRDRRELINIDAKFRLVLYDAANNETLSDISQFLWHLTLRVWYSFFDRSDWKVEVAGMLEEILRTREVLARRAAEEAAQVRRGFLLKYLERIKGKF